MDLTKKDKGRMGSIMEIHWDTMGCKTNLIMYKYI